MTSRCLRRCRATPVVLHLLAVSWPAVVVGHHGTSSFDGDRIVTLEGVVVENNWTNPHSFILLETRGVDGEVRIVEVEADGPSLLEPLGVTANSLTPGERIVAYVSPSRRASHGGVLGREAIREDGSVVALSVRYARERETAEVAPASSVIGTWVPDRSALFEFVPWRAAWPLTDAGRASLERYDITEPFAHAECIAATAPTVMLYPTAKLITSAGERLEIDADWMGATRTVYMDGRGHPDADERYLHGHSIGRWEGDTLVIDTANFTDNAIGNAFGIASGRSKHLVERLSLSQDGLTLLYEFTLEDPEYIRGPVSNSYVWHHRPDVSASRTECDLDAASRYLDE